MIVITGGGTGGHLAIARAMKDGLNKKGIKPLFIGSMSGQDRAWFENDEGFEAKYFLNTRGVVNQNLFGKTVSLFKIISGVSECFKIFKKHGVTKVFSVGGFSAAPASFAAILGKKDFYIHEQNAVVGSLNKLLRPYSKAFFNSFCESSPVKDYPVGGQFFEKARVREKAESVIFLGGSQGASAINGFALSMAKRLDDMGVKIIHQCGKNEYQKVYEEYRRLGIMADVFDFDKNIVERISLADFAVSRAGASTLWELSANGCPTLFVPYPYAAGDHQYHNAKFLVDKNAAFVVRQNELNEEIFFKLFGRNLSEVSQKAMNSIQNGAVDKIIEKFLL